MFYFSLFPIEYVIELLLTSEADVNKNSKDTTIYIYKLIIRLDYIPTSPIS